MKIRLNGQKMNCIIFKRTILNTNFFDESYFIDSLKQGDLPCFFLYILTNGRKYFLIKLEIFVTKSIFLGI